MVNYENLSRSHSIERDTLQFNSKAHQDIFMVLLVDFLSLPHNTLWLRSLSREGSRGTTFIGYLLNCCDRNSFQGDISFLYSSCNRFADWLDENIKIQDVQIPSVAQEITITIQRLGYLKICGNSAKHSFVRLRKIVDYIRNILHQNGVTVDAGQSYMALPKLVEKLSDDVFLAGASTIVFFLNEILWGIQYYLQHEFDRSYQENRRERLVAYKFDIPTEITDPLIRSMYWTLMNNVRQEPYLPRFTVDRFLHARS